MKELTDLLFDLLEWRLLVVRSSDAHFTLLRLLLNSANYRVHRRAVGLNTTRTWILKHYSAWAA